MAFELPSRGGRRGRAPRVNAPGVEDVGRVSVSSDPGLRFRDAPRSAFGTNVQVLPDTGPTFDASAFADIADTLQAVAERQQKRQDFTTTQEARLEYDRVTTQEFQRLQVEDDPSRPDFLEDWNDFLAQTEKRILDSAAENASPDAHEALRIDLLGKQNNWVDSAGRVHLDAAAARASNTYAQSINTLSAQALQYPDHVDTLIESGTETLRRFSDQLTPEQEQANHAAMRREIARSAIMGFVERDDFESADIIAAGFSDVLTPADQRSLIVDRKNAAISDVKALARDHLASIQQTGVGMDGFAERLHVLDGDDREALEADIERAHVYFDTTEAIKNASPADIVDVIRGLTPEPGSEGFAANLALQDTAKQAARDILQQRAADPAGYVLRNNQHIANGLEGQNVAAAIDRLLGEQQRLGIANPRVLTNTQASEIVQDLLQSPGQDRAVKLAALQGQYGRHSQRVISELVSNGLDDRSAVLASLAGDPALTQIMGEVIDTTSAEIRKNLPTGAKQEITENVSEELSDFFTAFTAGDYTGAGIKTANNVQSLVEDLAALYVRQGRDAATAASDAAAQIINSRYDVIDTDSMQVYVPRVINGRRMDVGNIETFADRMATRQGIEAFNPITSDFGPEFLQEERVFSAAENSGFWVTNETGDGAVLMVPFAGGGALPLMNERGEMYGFSFEEASSFVPSRGGRGTVGN